jgi:hypothetical protein
VRSRKDWDDYTRMHRQRCFLTAMANQLDVVSVLRNFGTLTSIVESCVRTDIPREQLPDLICLVGRLDPKRTLTVTFGRRYIARRRAHDRFPIPNVGAMRATAREAILQLRPDTGARRRDRPTRLLRAAREVTRRLSARARPTRGRSPQCPLAVVPRRLRPGALRYAEEETAAKRAAELGEATA